MKELVVTIIAVIVIMLFSLITLLYFATRNGEDRCHKKYGQNWEYRHQRYSADICVNENGDWKYL